MITRQLPLRSPLTGQSQIHELERQVYFLSERILGFAMHRNAEGAVAEISLEIDGDPGTADLETILNDFVDREIRNRWGLPGVEFWKSSRDPGDIALHDFDALTSAGLFKEIAPGQVLLAEGAVRLYRQLDRALLRRVGSKFAAQEHQYPATLPLAVLQRSGYFGSFPQHVYFASRIQGELPVYERLARSSGTPELGRLLLENAAPVDRVLPPTMCYHTFAQFAGSQAPAGLTCVTSRGAAFRHESRYHRTAERLSDFTIRETVFLGPPKQVEAAVAELREQVLQLVDELGLAGWCERANDPFFASGADAGRADTQRMLDLKQELRLPISTTESLAVASFNIHHTHFTESFDIRGDGATDVHSACVGAGLERLVYAVLTQFGPDESRWPALLRAAEGDAV
ncbi:hypothetical protein [Streptomyces sp. MUM 2J]|uniref:hypothetical protein n=1 Tax=Streptomyces sp. MUM 2J TaxID=2791987 RepID=UPI001F0351DA|nr:hypothetical protein [Streptomyces sp. MUM 2J]MCH0566164.1 hypothetical protein [Streptomyces sp. MUM 2J]